MNNKLFQEFPSVSTEEWEEVIKTDLKGADYNKKLVWKTLEGFSLNPYYRSENLKDLEYLKSNPAEFPYTSSVKSDNNWEIRQDFFVENISETASLIRKAVENGVSSIGLIIKKSISQADLESLLEGVDLEKTSVNIVSNPEQKIQDLLFAVAEKRNVKNLRGSNNFDTLGFLTVAGYFFDSTENIAKLSDKYPQFRQLSVNAKNFHNAGSSIVQELGLGLSMGAEYLKIYTENGYSVDKVARNIKFNFGVGSNYFMEIAKLRAARRLWAKIVEANSPKDIECAKMNIHSETSRWNKSVYDPYVNMLRVTTEAMSAVLGGTESLCVLPFDIAYENPTEFSLRIARNAQLIIKEESHFDRVIDPGAGSYYIENLTDAIEEHAWKIFLDVQEKGGYFESLKAGFVQNLIEETGKTRMKNVATRREIILGTNQYPNFTEKKDQTFEVKKCCCCGDSHERIVEPIKFRNASSEFTELRLATDKAAKQPVVFMLTIGNLTFRKARAQFSCNFFGCAGFKVIDNNGFKTIDEGLTEAKLQNADIIVLCSSDDEYETFAVEAAQKLDGKIFVVAGNPACRPALEEKGIMNYIHVKSNVLEDLKNYQKLLGIN